MDRRLPHVFCETNGVANRLAKKGREQKSKLKKYNHYSIFVLSSHLSKITLGVYLKTTYITEIEIFLLKVL